MIENIIKRIAKNNPNLDGYERLSVDNDSIVFYTENGDVNETDHINVPIDMFYKNQTVVSIKDDGYVVAELEWMSRDDIKLETTPDDKTIKVPYIYCDIVMNDEGINRKTELPF